MREIDQTRVDNLANVIGSFGWIDSYPIVYYSGKGDDQKVIVNDGNHRVFVLQRLMKNWPSRFADIKIKCKVVAPLDSTGAKAVGHGLILIIIVI